MAALKDGKPPFLKLNIMNNEKINPNENLYFQEDLTTENCKSWTPTMNLRFVTGFSLVTTLQQEWVCEDGTREWRYVETVII